MPATIDTARTRARSRAGSRKTIPFRSTYGDAVPQRRLRRWSGRRFFHASPRRTPSTNSPDDGVKHAGNAIAPVGLWCFKKRALHCRSPTVQLREKEMPHFTDTWSTEDTRACVRRWSVVGHSVMRLRYDCCKRIVVGYESDILIKCPTHGSHPTVDIDGTS